MALESGDTSAVVSASRIVLDRCGLGPRDCGVRVSLPRVETPAGVVAAFAELLEQVARGELAPAAAGDVAALLREQRDALSLAEIDRRFRALEEP